VESKSAKYSLWATLIAALIAAIVALYIHYDGKSEKKVQIALEKAVNESNKTANLKVSNIYVPPINTELDSVFFAEVSNRSLNNAKDLNFKINFGAASITSCETLPINVIKPNAKFETSFVHFSYQEIEKKEKIYIYCFLSSPTFESLFISGSNLFTNIDFNYKEHVSNKTDSTSSFLTFFKVIGSIVAVIFIIYFTVLLISLFTIKVKKMGVKFE
jgi:hypothetical protein